MFGQSLLSAFGSAACTTDTDQLFATDVQTTSLATYQLNNATTSIPSNTYPGTASNITYAAGKFGNAAVFNGSSSNISLPLSSWLSSTSAKSCSVWFKTSATGGGNRAIISDYGSGASYNFDCFLIPTDGKIFLVTNRGTQYYTSSINSFNDGQWHLAVIVDDIPNGNTKLYVDNNQEISISTGSGTVASTVLYIGTYGTGYYWDGSIDQVRIFNTALSQAAITALYNETTTTAQSASVDYQLANPNSIAYYKMSDATDQFGNYNGTIPSNALITSPVNFNTEGKFGFAGAFNGTSNGINLPSSLNTNVINPTGAFSISMWINANDISTIQYLFAANISDNIDLGINTGQGAGKIVWTIYNGSYSFLTSTTTITTNTWYHIVATYNNSLRELFIDGVSQGTATKTLVQSNIEPTLGYRFTGGNVLFNGKMDQIRIYDSAISAANVTTLYEEIECPIPSDTLGVCNYPIPATSLYQLQGPTVSDNCGNYPGTIVGGATFTSGKFGNALDLTTSSTYAQLQTLPSSWSAGPCSLSIWVNMRTLTSGWANGSYIFSAKADWRLQFTSNSSYGITFNKWNSTYGNNGNNELKSAVPSLNTWYHVVVTDNQANDATDNLKLYINGVLEDSQIGYASPRTFSGYASIGASGEGRNGINGQIDQLRLFPYILTQADVTKLYNE